MAKKKVDEILVDEHNATCSVCNILKPNLKSLTVFWIPLLWRKVDRSDPAYKYKSTSAYNMADVRQRRYLICEDCHKKHVVKKMLSVALGFLIAVFTPILYFIEQNTGNSIIDGFTPDLESILGGLLIGIIVMFAYFPFRRKAYNYLAVFQLRTDLINGKFDKKISAAAANGAKACTELRPDKDIIKTV